MAKKHNLEFAGVSDLTASDITIIKALFNWSYKTSIANAFNIHRKTGLSEPQVSKRLRELKDGKGIVFKAISGSFVLQDHYKKRILQEYSIKTDQQQPILTKDDPIETTAEVDKFLNEQIEASKNDVNEQEEKKKLQLFKKNTERKVKKKVEAKKYNRARARAEQ